MIDVQRSGLNALAMLIAIHLVLAKEMFAVVPGTNAGALGALMAAGLKTEFFGAWMSAKPVGSFDGYLLAGGMLL